MSDAVAIHAYTSFSLSYLNRARVFASTLRKRHPDWTIWAVLVDRPPEHFEVRWENEDFDRVITPEDLFGPEVEGWLFGLDIVEACTAVKGAAMQRIMNDDTCTKVLYFDPDIAVLGAMSEVVKLLDNCSIVLTPHQIDPEDKESKIAILDNEVASLQYGVFNLGFIAVSNCDEGRRFASWWADRLYYWCHDSLASGIFVDQKWCNLIPCFFNDVKILRDPGYNVASWNISQRKMSFDKDGRALINGVPLRFYHFTKLGPVGDSMTQRYAKDNLEVYELWFWYRNAVAAATDDAIPAGWWFYSSFDNGVPIPKAARVLYRERSDLQRAFPHPREVSGGFFDWLQSETKVFDA
jgi:hypothetical protein